MLWLPWKGSQYWGHDLICGPVRNATTTTPSRYPASYNEKHLLALNVRNVRYVSDATLRHYDRGRTPRFGKNHSLSFGTPYPLYHIARRSCFLVYYSSRNFVPLDLFVLVSEGPMLFMGYRIQAHRCGSWGSSLEELTASSSLSSSYYYTYLNTTCHILLGPEAGLVKNKSASLVYIQWNIPYPRYTTKHVLTTTAKIVPKMYESTWKCGELKLYFSPSAGG